MSKYVQVIQQTRLQRLTKSKSLISLIFFVYCVSILSQLIITLSSTISYAANVQSLNRLIAVLVDQNIYNIYQSQVDRYASEYMQTQYSDSKALIIPIQASNFQAQDIHKMLQNLYFEGQKDTPSQLIGVTLIGDIALPVVNDNGFYYQSIYPYVDFIKPQFVYSEQDQIFINNPEGTKQVAEIWHNLIQFKTNEEYATFFQKLSQYASNPKNRTSDKVRVDDLITEQQSYDQGSLNNYANQFIFAEDLARQRYTNLLADLTNAQAGNKVYDMFANASKTPFTGTIEDELPSDLAKQQQDVSSNLKGYFQRLSKLASLLQKKKAPNSNTFDTHKVGGLSSTQGVPTLFLQQIMDDYLKDYHKLYSEEYHTSINNLVEPSGRYYNSGDKIGINSHIRKTYQHDALTKTIITNINDQLEKTVDAHIESEKPYMTVPVPTKKLTYRPGKFSVCGGHTNQMILDDIYDVSYFGSDPWTSETIQDMMIFRGTFLNLTGVNALSGYDYRNVPLIDKESIGSRSVGASYGFQSREIEANRGYNVTLVEQDREYMNELKQMILVGKNDCRVGQLTDDDKYIRWYWGGYTPMNISGGYIETNGSLALDLQRLDPMSIWSPSYAINGATFGGTVFDIAGSKMINPKYRTLGVVEGTQEYVTTTKTDLNWIAPEDCSGAVNDYLTIKANLESITAEYNQNCTNNGDQYCQTLRDDIATLTQQVSDFENSPDNNSKVDRCIPTTFTTSVEVKPELKRDISLSGISDNYTGYTQFIAVQGTAYRPELSLRTRAIAGYVEHYIRKFKGQDGLNVAIAKAVEAKSIQPILFCHREDTSSLFNFDKRKRIYSYSEVDFFKQVTRTPVGGEKIRILINNGSGSATISGNNELTLIDCESKIKSIEEKEEEINIKTQEFRSVGTLQFLKKIQIVNTIIKLQKEAKDIQSSNPQCFIETPIYHYEVGKAACNGNGGYTHMYDYYYKTLPTIYVHKSPTADELYGKELKVLRGVQFDYAVPDAADMRKEGRKREQYHLKGYKYNGLKFEVDSISFVLAADEYSLSSDKTKVYFSNNATINLYGKSISLKNVMGIVSGSSLLLTGTDTPLSRLEQEQGGRKPWVYPRYGGMNMTTSDRPIDSVRYTSFQGIGGDLVKVVYPNLYNVAVFDSTGKLKTELQIKQSIKDYLIKQAQIYRQQLQTQQEKSQTFYNTQKKGFDILAKSDRLASPNRVYDVSKIGDDFFIKGLAMKVGAKQFTSDDVLTILARNLYYQNLISPLKVSSPILDKELDNLYNSVAIDNLNSKRKFIFDTYLTYDSNKTTGGSYLLNDYNSLSGLLLPAYDEKGYEIISLTSNGSDYHVDPNLNPLLKQFQVVSDTTKAKPRQELYKENLSPLICNGKSYNQAGVLLLQYPKAFQCWLEDVKRSSIKITVNGDLVDLIKNISQSGRKAATTSYFADQIGYFDTLKKFGGSVVDVPGQRSSLLESAVKTVAPQANIDLGSTKMQQRRGKLATKSGLNRLGNDSLYDPTGMTESEKALSTIMHNISIDTSTTQLSINGTGILTLSTLNKTSPYDITISGTGSSCLKLNGTNICNTTISLKNQGAADKTVSYLIEVVPGGALGDAGVLAKFCVQGTTTCITYPIIYRIVPGSIASIKVIDILNGGYLARGSQMPIIIQGYDRDGHLLSTASDLYTIKTDQGEISNIGQKAKNFDINTRSNVVFVYDSTNVKTQDRITIIPSYPDGGLLPTVNYSVAIAEPELTLTTRQGSRTLQQGVDIQLPSKPNTLTKTIASGQTSLIPDQVPMIRIGLKQFGGKQVLGSIRISSQNGLITPGVIGSQLITGDNGNLITQYVRSNQDSFVITGSSQEIYLYPSYRAGKDIINITIGDRNWAIPVIVRPGAAAGVTTNAPHSLSVGQTGTVELKVTDYRGNQITTDTWIDLTTYGYLFTLGESKNPTTTDASGKINGIQTIKGSAQISIIPKAIIGKGYITSQIRGLPLDEQRSSYAGVLVQATLRPTKKINGTILQLKGSDRHKSAPSLISQSNKVLSVPTTFIQPSQLRKSNLVIGNQGGLYGEQSKKSRLTTVQGNWNIITDKDLVIVLDKTSSYQLSQATSGLLATKPSGGGLYYIPTLQDSTIQINRVNASSIIINNTVVLDTANSISHPDLRITYLDHTDYGAGVYEVSYRGRVVGNLVLYRTNRIDSSEQIDIIKSNLSDLYDVITGYVGGSTNGQVGIHIINRESSYEQSDTEQPQGTKLIAQFGQGLTVGEAVKYDDQFSVTYGDASLSKATLNVPAYALVADTDDKPVTKNLPYDTGRGQVIYHNTDKSIHRITSIDFNNDKLKDLIVVYVDGSVRLLKNYGGKQPWRDLGHLMIIADGIKDLYIGDVDKNNYQDIIVYTQKGKLRVYYNTNGEFDVDGYPVCLDIPGGPDDLSKLYYWAIRDMDLDGGIDITTYDHNGDIKVFYGGRGGTNEGSSYVSRDRGVCDPSRKSRQQSTLVQSFGINLLSTPIKDDSLIHRATHVTHGNVYEQTMRKQEISYYDSYDKLSELENEVSPTMSSSEVGRSGVSQTTYSPPQGDYKSSTFASDLAAKAINSINLTQSINNAYQDIKRYIPVNNSLRPLYQTKGATLYMPISKLTNEDAFNVSKTFKDLNGGVLIDRDLVEITININGTPGTRFAYLEKLTGPWVVPLNDQGTLEGMSEDFINLKEYVSYNRDEYIFAINNAVMNDNGSIKLTYIVQYRSEKIAEVEVVPSSSYPIIQASSVDGCQKTQRQFTPLSSMQPRRYSSKTISYNEELIKQQTKSYTDYDTATQKQTKEVIELIGKENGIFDYLKERWNNDNVFQRAQGIIDKTYLESIPLQLRIGLQSGSKEQEISRGISDTTNKLCNGFKFDNRSCGGTTPPIGIPFNMAFPPLTPGVISIMGKKVFEDKGLPAIATPIPSPPYVAFYGLPVPKGVGGRPDPQANESQFRLYMTPTLTASLGFGVCFGSYASVGIKLPAPFKNILGNCIVIGTQPLLKGQKQCSVQSDPSYSPPPQPQLPTCMGSLTTDLSKISPIQMVTLNEQTKSWLEEQRNNSPSDLYYRNTYYGGDARQIYASSHTGIAKAIQASNSVIKLNQPARVGSSAEVFTLSMSMGSNSATQHNNGQLGSSFSKDTKTGKVTLRSIGKGAMKGVGACLVQIADNQIQYVKNNLLTSSLTVVLPNLSNLGLSNNRSQSDIRTDGLAIKNNIVQVWSGIKSDLQTITQSEQNKNLYEEIVSQTGATDSITEQAFYKKSFNPFYHIEQLFNEVKLINISHKEIILKVPYVRMSELTMHKSKLIGRKERNQAIVEQWLAYGSGLEIECEKLSDIKKQECKNLLSQVITINNQFGQLQKSARMSLDAIDQYIHFQTVLLPTWKEQHIRYLTELTSVIDSIMSQLAARSTQNAARFTSWTSAIRSMIVAIKTRQLLVDFALSWKERCGTCKVDNYDFATCSLNGLCPNFPLFAWPNFRTPDITIDLSNIDAGVDIVIPNFRFSPINVPLSRFVNLPDLPLPPQLGSPVYAQLSIIVPTLPVLPSPPPLPTLPSLSMSVDMDLPLLPPAPKIPMLPETLSAVIQVAEFIGQLLCIVKGDVGLVGEMFVKQKIEQITARTREVHPFDSIIPIISEPRPQGYNARVDAYVNLRFYFDGLYDVFDDLGNQWNIKMGEIQQDFRNLINSGANWINDQITSGVNAVKQEINNNISGANGLEPLKYDVTIKPLSSEELDSRLVAVLKQFSSQVQQPELVGNARMILGMIEMPIQAQPNIKGIEQVYQQAQTIVSKKLHQAQSEYHQIKYNYDTWLDTLVSDQYVSDITEQTTLSTPLYTINPEVETMIESSDIITDYLNTNKQLLDHYESVLTNRTPESLSMNEVDYYQSRSYIVQMNQAVQQSLTKSKLLAYKQPTDDIESVDKTSSQGGDSGWGSSTTNSTQPKQIQNVGFDQSTQREGYLVDTEVLLSGGSKIKAAVDVIKPEWLGTQYRERSFKEDINGTNSQNPDIILRDDSTIYIKYADQKNIHNNHTTSKTIYRLPALTSPSQLNQSFLVTDGYISYDPGILSRAQQFKVWSTSYAITNFQLQGQNYDSAIFQWLNPDMIGQAKDESYIIRITQLVDRHPDRLGPDTQTQYILIVPIGKSIDINNSKLVIPGSASAHTIKDLIDRKIIHDIVNFDPSSDTIIGLLRNLTRRWQYAQVARIELTNNAYRRTSSWSNQDVGGYQIVADTVAPIPEVKLVRVATKQTVGGGASMKGYINTNYDLVVTRKDNISLSRTSVDGVVQPSPEKTIITRIYEQKPKTLSYSFSALDSSDNATTIQVTVTIQNPELETLNTTNTNGSWGTITAKLTPDLDDGVIQFQQKNISSWENLLGMPGSVSGYNVKPLQTLFIGGLYQFPNSRGLKNADGSDAGTVSSQGQITTQDLNLLVKFPHGYPVISMVNASGVVQYEITYAPQALTGSVPIDIKAPAQYRLLSLQNFTSATAGVFAGGQCIAPQLGECEIYVSKQGDIWVDPAVRNNYYGTYLWRNGHSVYQIMRDKTFVTEINLVIKDIK